MKRRLLHGAIVVALAFGVGEAAAQVGQPVQSQPPIQLDAAQKAAIVTAVRDTRNPPPGTRFSTSIGAQVPPSIDLYVLPIAALSQAPEVRNLRYTTVQNQIVLVDPTTMRVVDVIPTPPGNP